MKAKKGATELNIKSITVIILFSLAMFLFIGMFTNDISFDPPTPDNATSTENTSIEINITMNNTGDFSGMIFNWNGTNYTIFSNNLIAMFNFENLSVLGESATLAVDIAGGDNNATMSNPIVNITGKYGKGLEFDGTETKRVYLDDSDNLDLTNFTISFWFNRKGSGCDGTCSFGNCFADNLDVITAKGGGGGDGGVLDCNWIIGVQSSNLVFCSEYNGGSDFALAGGGITTISNGVWYYGTVTFDGTTVKTYVNGVLENSGALGGTIDTNTVQVGIGIGLETASNTVNGAWNGTLDEFSIWNKTLSQEEIFELYRSNLFKYDTDKFEFYINKTKNQTDGLDNGVYTFEGFFENSTSWYSTGLRTITIAGAVVDNPPTTTLVNPVNNNISTSTSISFNCSAIDDFNLANITIYGNWSGGWHSNSTSDVTGTSNSSGWILTLEDNQDYIWNCLACDNSSNCSFGSSNYSLTVNTSYVPPILYPPLISFVNPTPDDEKTTSYTSIELNISITESNLSNFTYNWDGTNYTFYDNTLRVGFNFDNVSELGETYETDTIVYDISMWHNDGNLTNTSAPTVAHKPDWIPVGKFGGAFKFNTPDYNTNGECFLIPHDDSLNPYDQDFAMMMWFNCTETTDTDLSRKGSTATGGGRWYKMEIGGYGTPDLISLQFNSDGTDATLEWATPICDDNWHFAIGQRVGNTAELWIDGVRRMNGALTGSIYNTANLTVGCKDTMDDDFYNGTMDEYRVYINRSFSESEIQQLYMSNINKYDTDKYSFYSNQTKNATDLLDDGVYNYQGFALNQDGWNSTDLRTINIATSIYAIVETDPVDDAGDIADDPAIWLHPTDSSRSTIIGTSKEAGANGGLYVYNISGSQLHFIKDGKKNNVDVRYNFTLNEEVVDIVGASDRNSNNIMIYKINSSDGNLTNITGNGLSLGYEPYGFCLSRDNSTGNYYAFVNNVSGEIQQYRLTDQGDGLIGGNLVRSFSVDTQPEGMVVDDELGYFYIGEEDVGLWRFNASEDGGTTGVLIDNTTTGHLTADVEGLSIYYTSDLKGYLIASSQGNSIYIIYNRTGDNEYIKNFSIGANAELSIDAVSDTDGIEVISTPLGNIFPYGMFVVQDGTNTGGNTNFKFVRWDAIANVFSPELTIDTGWNPRLLGSSGESSDTTAPNITLNNPLDGTQDTDGVIRFEFTPSDESSIDNCSLNYQDGVYSRLNSVTNGSINIIEVVGVSSGHPFYLDNLRWFVNCTDEFGNEGSSEIWNLDTTDGDGGGGGDSQPNTKNPSYINVNYPEEWVKGSEVKVIVQAYNQNQELYEVPNVNYVIEIDGVSIKESSINNNSETETIFSISKSAEEGENSIKLFVADERELEHEINFKIVEADNEEKKEEDKLINDETIKILFWSIAGLAIIVFIMIIGIALLKDTKK